MYSRLLCYPLPLFFVFIIMPLLSAPPFFNCRSASCCPLTSCTRSGSGGTTVSPWMQSRTTELPPLHPPPPGAQTAAPLTQTRLTKEAAAAAAVAARAAAAAAGAGAAVVGSAGAAAAPAAACRTWGVWQLLIFWIRI